MSVKVDIIKAFEAVAAEKAAIVANAEKINTMITSGVQYLEDNSSTIEDNLEQAGEKITSELGNLGQKELKNLETALSNVPLDFPQELDNLFTDLGKVESDIDLSNVIDSLLGNLPADIVKSPIVNSIKELFDELFGGRFSIAIKPLQKRDTSSSSSSGGDLTTQQKEELADILFSVFETLIEDLLTHQFTTPVFPSLNLQNPWTIEDALSIMESKLESTVASEMSTLESSLSTMISTLQNTSPLTMSVVMTELETFFKAELTSAMTAAESVKALIKELWDLLKVVFDQLWTTATSAIKNADSGLAALYIDLTGEASPPTLTEVISLLIAIPLTLVEQATGKTFPIPGPFQAISTQTSKEMIGSVQIIDLTVSLLDKVYGYYQDQHDNPISWKYKFFMGALGSAETIVSQVAYYPQSGGMFSSSGITKDNALWGISWYTGFGFSLYKWILGTYIAKKYSNQDNIEAFEAKAPNVCTDFANEYKKIVANYTNAKGTVSKAKISSLIPYLSGLRKNLKTFGANASSIGDQPDNLQTCVDFIKGFSLDIAKIKGEILRLKNDILATKFSNQRRKITIAGNAIIAQQLLFDELKELANNIDIANADKTAKSTFFSVTCPKIDIGLNLATLAWKIYLNTSEPNTDPKDLAVPCFSTGLSLISDGASIYYAKNPPAEGSSDAKGQPMITNGIFGASKLYEFIQIVNNFTPPKKK